MRQRKESSRFMLQNVVKLSRSAGEVHAIDEKEQNDQIQLFEDQKLCTAWDAEQEEWYFSVVTAENARTLQRLVTGAVEGAAEMIEGSGQPPQDKRDLKARRERE